jgi:ACS family hexuronate transporter-like MFS transporter
MSVSYIDRQTLAAIAPSVKTALQIDQKQYGTLIGSFSIAYLFGAPLAGIIVDKFGARRGFAMAVFVWSIVAGAHALATSFAMLFALRILLGTAESPSFPSAAQAIRRALPGARRPFAYGLLFTGSSLGAVVAGKLAVKLDAAFGFQWAFVGTAVIGSLWIPVWLVVSRGAGLDAPATRTGSPADKVDTAEKNAPVSWFRMATSAPVLRAMIAVLGSAPGILFVMNWTSLYLVEHWHMPKNDVGNYLVVPPLVFDFGVLGFGWLASTSRRVSSSRRSHPTPKSRSPFSPRRSAAGAASTCSSPPTCWRGSPSKRRRAPEA